MQQISPTNIIIFGATGDLMARKIVPSLFFLFQSEKLPSRIAITGFSRKNFSDEMFRDYIFDILKTKEVVAGKSEIEGFLKLFHYKQGDFSNLADYELAKVHLNAIDNGWGVCSNKIYYLAVPPQIISLIVDNLTKSNLSNPCGGVGGWARIIVEKPFGQDEASAKKLEEVLHKFKESQIYRIDHYFGKEMVQGILNFRFSNNLLENSWDNKHIEKIEMRVWESIGVEDRGAFYDSIGALRDVGQNHLLELLALLTMENPTKTGGSLQSERAKVLNKLVRPTLDQAKKTSFRAQYKNYQAINGVKSDSQAETYFKFKTEISSRRWKGVPIIIESGKRMGLVQKEISVIFRHPPACLLCPSDVGANNKVIFSLHPDQGIKIDFWAKDPGFHVNTKKRSFNFMLYEQKTKQPYVEEYAKLLLDCMQGNQDWFVSKDEVSAAWKAIDTLLLAWEKNLLPLHSYSPDTNTISQEADLFLKEQDVVIPREIGIIGLGKMGSNLALRLMEKGWRVVGYNRSIEEIKKLEQVGLIGAEGIQALVGKVNTKRKVIWLMIPAGSSVDEVLFSDLGLVKYLKQGDIIIDGGNSFYKDTIKRAEQLTQYGINYIDCGVSGGPSGARNGACLMIGGERKIFSELESLFRTIAKVNGYEFFDGVGAGHFVKMVHNGIEYGMMQAIAEGFNLLKKSKYNLNLTKIANIYNNGSVIESRLIEWLENAFLEHGEGLEKISGSVAHSGEGEWTVKTAEEMEQVVEVIKQSFEFRLKSKDNPSYTGKLLTSIRGQFGGHNISK